jgi:ABC-2 type transport system ATP-binding protein
LTKYYGDVMAVDDLSFEIEEGHVYGFLGPNGAGKSTTMNIMTGCLSATAGRVLIDGYDIFETPGPAKKLIGYLPEQPPLYVTETPAEYLTFVGEAKGLRGAPLRARIEAVIGQTRLEPVRHRRISALSKGYRQRVGIAQALLGDPKVIILDEPTIGLDPLQIVEIRDLIKELGRDRTVIFSSHILSEVQAICDRILIIAHGRLVAFDEPGKLEHDHRATSEVRLLAEAGADDVRAILAGVDHVTGVTLEPAGADRVTVRVTTDCDDSHDVSRALFFAFAGQGKALLEMTVKTAGLEDIFIGLTEGAAARGEAAEAAEVAEVDEIDEPEEPQEGDGVTEPEDGNSVIRNEAADGVTEPDAPDAPDQPAEAEEIQETEEAQETEEKGDQS